MKRILVTTVGLGAAIGLGSTFGAAPAQAGPASFIQTCSDITISSSLSDGATIKANCGTMTGQMVPASIRLKYIENVDGVLTYQPADNDGTFARSCVAVTFDPATATLSARCKDLRGVFKRPTSLVIENIGNYNGVLKYDGE
ncbi:CVNH domain-containing protein [Alteriqipengyuania sp.]|uniref:CVNH domain-containing protein n=1 Tax=Alteriqipengyuania sp. TaxID=2800692 RepID=UPI00351171DC